MLGHGDKEKSAEADCMSIKRMQQTKLKEDLRRYKFRAQKAVKKWLRSKDKKFYCDGIQNLKLVVNLLNKV